jgi:hypothetical protein
LRLLAAFTCAATSGECFHRLSVTTDTPISFASAACVFGRRSIGGVASQAMNRSWGLMSSAARKHVHGKNVETLVSRPSGSRLGLGPRSLSWRFPVERHPNT